MVIPVGYHKHEHEHEHALDLENATEYSLTSILSVFVSVHGVCVSCYIHLPTFN